MTIRRRIAKHNDNNSSESSFALVIDEESKPKTVYLPRKAVRINVAIRRRIAKDRGAKPHYKIESLYFFSLGGG
jgi:hypothetical protein